jgi:SP family sugar:H+ symporter-like MFS transporter
MFFQQITGQAFTSQYSVVFYQQQGFTNAFLLGVVNNIVSLVCTISTSLFVDRLGRRPILLVGGTAMAAFLFLLGGLGVNHHPDQNGKNALVASVVLYGAAYALSWAPMLVSPSPIPRPPKCLLEYKSLTLLLSSYIFLGEVSSVRVKEKTNDLAVSVSVLTTFVVSFTVPYLLNAPYANLQAKVGFIYGSFTIVSVIVAYLMIPEMKGRSLEEIDRLFASGVSMRKFKDVETVRVEDAEKEQGGGKVSIHEEIGDKA